MTSTEGIIYILTNEAMPNIIKIGKTGRDDLNLRLKELDNTSMPLPFQCYFATKVKDMNSVEKALHFAFGDKRIRSNREFFKDLSPDRVMAVLELLSIGEVTPKADIVESESDFEAMESFIKKSKFRFNLVDIKVGDKIYFLRDPSITATVISETSIDYNGRETSLSASAKEILKNNYGYTDKYSVQGTLYWGYKESEESEIESLVDRRNRFESKD